MIIEKIKDNNTTLAVLVKGESKEGLTFLSEDRDYLQVGLWNYQKGKQLLAHKHLLAKREVLKTQEVLFIKKGSLKAEIYSEEDKLVKTLIISAGDIIILLNGGHGYEILEDNTEVIEIKNGPYLGAEKDRKRI